MKQDITENNEIGWVFFRPYTMEFDWRYR